MATGTFGDSSTPSYGWYASQNWYYLLKATAPSDVGEVVKISIKFQPWGFGDTNFKGIILQSDLTLIAVGDATALPGGGSAGIYESAFSTSPPTLVAGQDYYIGFIVSGSDFAATGQFSSNGTYKASGQSYSSPATPGGLDDAGFSGMAYCLVTYNIPSGGGTVTRFLGVLGVGA